MKLRDKLKKVRTTGYFCLLKDFLNNQRPRNIPISVYAKISKIIRYGIHPQPIHSESCCAKNPIGIRGWARIIDSGPKIPVILKQAKIAPTKPKNIINNNFILNKNFIFLGPILSIINVQLLYKHFV